MNRSVSALLAVAMLGVGCGTPSQVDPSAQVDISGTVVDQSGSTVADARAVLIKEVGFDEFLSGAMTVMTTWGFACAVDEPVDPCGEYAHFATTDGSGRFVFRLPGSDVRSGFGTASTMTATVGTDPGPGQRTGAAVSLSFQVQEEVLELPPLRLWQPQVDLAMQNDTFTVTWSTMPDGYPTEASYQAVVTDHQGKPVWTLATSGQSSDLRVLEDTEGGVAVQATTRTTVNDRGADVVYRSAQLPVRGPGAPPSRGAACAATADGYRPVVVTPCPFTDGDLTTREVLDMPTECASAGSECDYPQRSVVIDLGTTRDLRLLVIRGDEDEFVIEISDDGLSWREVLAIDMTDQHVAVPLPAGTSGRHVRLRADSNVGLLSEVSIW